METSAQRELMKLSGRDRRSIVSREVHNRIKNDHGYDYFNNFYSNLPEGDKRQLCVNLGIMDKNYGEFVVSHGSTQERTHASDLMWSQTPRQFFETIDATIDELHISKEKLLSLQLTLSKMMDSHPINPSDEQIKGDMKVLNQICEMTVPLYIELRVKGYTRQDLSG